jgi:predicted small secreted protein
VRKIRQVLCCVFALAILLFSLSGCNTWAGVGQDIQRSGEAIEGSAE